MILKPHDLYVQIPLSEKQPADEYSSRRFQEQFQIEVSVLAPCNV